MDFKTQPSQRSMVMRFFDFVDERVEKKTMAKSYKSPLIRCAGRDGFWYYESGRKAAINSELLGGGDFDEVVYPMNTMKWADSSIPLSHEELDRARRLLAEFLKHRKVQWTDPTDQI